MNPFISFVVKEMTVKLPHELAYLESNNAKTHE